MRIDIAGAERKYRGAAERGDPAAQFSLGHAYFLRGMETGDYGQALDWIEKAAAQDYAMALAHLGYMYSLGEGVSVDLEKARAWFRKAAEQGEPHYQYEYATMCWNGDFGAPDPKEAEVWWSRAADQGYAEAHCALAHSCDGIYNPAAHCDLVKAYMWYTLAALQDKPGHPPSVMRSSRDRIAKDMTQAEIDEAERRVHSWLEDHATAMGEDLVTHWRERVAEPLTPEEIAEAERQLAKWMESIGKDDDPNGR